MDTKLRWFQYRIVHRIIPTNRYLFKCKIVDSPLCNICNQEEETISHLMWECEIVQNFWSRLLNILKEKCILCETLELSEPLILFGIKEKVITDKAIDLIILIAKYYIYSCKWQSKAPHLKVFEKILKERISIEESCPVSGGTYEFLKTWIPYQSLLTDIW